MSQPDVRSVLVVEDDDELLGILCDALRPVGIAVDAVPSGAAALQRMDSRRFDAVLTDVNMKGMTGIGLLVAMRDRMIDSPVVMLTGMQNEDMLLQALRLGAMDFIRKPSSGAEIVAVMRRAVELGVHLREQEKELDALVAELPPPHGERLLRLREKRRIALLWQLNNHAHKAK